MLSRYRLGSPLLANSLKQWKPYKSIEGVGSSSSTKLSEHSGKEVGGSYGCT